MFVTVLDYFQYFSGSEEETETRHEEQQSQPRLVLFLKPPALPGVSVEYLPPYLPQVF